MKAIREMITFDPAEALNSEESRAVFLEEAIATGDAGYIAHAQAMLDRARMRALRKSDPRPPGDPSASR